jgi:7-cyano-7-deazaguanine synthase
MNERYVHNRLFHSRRRTQALGTKPHPRFCTERPALDSIPLRPTVAALSNILPPIKRSRTLETPLPTRKFKVRIHTSQWKKHIRTLRMNTPNHDQVALLLSGGLDSCVLAVDLATRSKQVHPIYVRQGLVWEQVELHWVKRFLDAVASENIEPLREIELPMLDVYDSHWSITGKQTPDHLSEDREVYLPGRNLLLLAKTALFCALNRIPVIALGPLSANPFPDGTPEFFSKFQEMASLALNFSLFVQTPYLTLSKADVIGRGSHLPLQLTFSCISPIGFAHCGACNKCAERRKAFQDAGIEDKTTYHAQPALS